MLRNTCPSKNAALSLLPPASCAADCSAVLMLAGQMTIQSSTTSNRHIPFMLNFSMYSRWICSRPAETSRSTASKIPQVWPQALSPHHLQRQSAQRQKDDRGYRNYTDLTVIQRLEFSKAVLIDDRWFIVNNKSADHAPLTFGAMRDGVDTHPTMIGWLRSALVA